MRRFLWGLALLAAFGVLELYVLYRLWGVLGGVATFGIVAGGAIVGVVAGRAQGMGVLRRWLDATADGYEAEEGLVDGLLVLLGAALLVLPGVLGDVLGLALLVPPVRRRIAERLRRRAAGWVQAGGVEVFTARMDAPSFLVDDEPSFSHDDREIIDVVGEVVEEKPERLLGPGR